MFFFRYGHITDVNLVRDKKTGKSKGFAFIAYENFQSATLAVDNFNGIKVRAFNDIRLQTCSNALTAWWTIN